MRTKIFLCSLCLAFLAIVGCSDDDSNPNGEPMGRLTVQLTDAPFPFDLVAEANVTIFKVDARLKGGLEGDSIGDGSSFVTLMEEELAVNLLELSNGVTQELADLDVPVGTYDLIRVYVNGVNVVLTDGRSFDLDVPSGQQTGIKIFIDPGLAVSGGISSDLLLDFDVSRSFVAKGNLDTPAGITGFNFKPVIKASNLSTAGTLSGTVVQMDGETTLPLEAAQVSVLDANNGAVTSGATTEEGSYSILGLEAGTYKVFTSLNGYLDSDTLEVKITAANITVQDFILEAEAVETGN